MENAIEALETACVVILLATAIMVFLCIGRVSKDGEETVLRGISREWLINEGEE